MNDVNTKRTELANELAAAGAELLDFTMTACAIAAIPDTEPQQYVAAGTPENIAALLPATIDPQRRQKHGDRPSADDLQWDEADSRATAPHAGIDVPADFIDFWQLMVEHGQFDGAHGYGVFYERHAKSLHKALLAAQPVEAADPLEQKLPCEITIGTMRLTTNDNLRTLVKVAQLIHQHARENGERLSALGALPVEADCAQVAMGEPSEISARLRERATGAMANQNDARLMLAAADECDRFYGGMMAWKRTAEKKDRDYNEARMRFENYKCGQRATESAAAPADLRESLKGVADVLEAFGDLPDELMSDEKWHEHQAWQKLSRAREVLESQPTTQAEGK